MYYYYVIKNWCLSKYYDIFGKCIYNENHIEPLLNDNIDKFEDAIEIEPIEPINKINI